MPFDPQTRNLIPEIIRGATNDLQQSIDEYRKRQSQRNFNTNAFETILSQYPGAVPPDVIKKFQASNNPDAQSGIVVNLVNKIKQDTEQENRLAEIKAQRAPFTPTITNIATPEGSGLPPKVPVFQTGPNDSHVLQAPPAPFQPNQQQMDDAVANGQHYFETSKGWELRQALDEKGDRVVLTPQEIADYKRTGKVPLRVTAKSFQVVADPSAQLATNSDAVQQFNATIGTTYGVKAADLYKVDFKTPKAIKYVNSDNDPVSTEEAAKMGYGATAVVPFGDTTKRIPLPEWNAIVNQWNQLPKVGSSAVTGGGPAAVQDKDIPRVQTVPEAMALPPGTPFYDKDGILRRR